MIFIIAFLFFSVSMFMWWIVYMNGIGKNLFLLYGLKHPDAVSLNERNLILLFLYLLYIQID